MSGQREVCVLVGRGGAVLWADASDSAEALADSRARWEAIWRHRDELEAIVHSHPVGPAAFSAEDESTMQAIDAGLGRALRYCVVAPGVTVARTDEGDEPVVPEPGWAPLVRLASGMRKED
jgi:ribulose-5-phosphate 4-epimerase/fuculose-1-phosphate aldolase